MNLKPSRMALLGIMLSVASPSILSDTASDQAPASSQNSAAMARDTMITQQIKAKLSASDSIPKDIQVNTQNGIVTLMGEVDAAAQKNAIEGAARSTPGVMSINSQIQVKPQPEMNPQPTMPEPPATMPGPSD